MKGSSLALWEEEENIPSLDSSHQDWTSLEKGTSSGGCRWRLWGSSTITVECFHSKHIYYPWLEGLLKIISVIYVLETFIGKLIFIVCVSTNFCLIAVFIF